MGDPESLFPIMYCPNCKWKLIFLAAVLDLDGLPDQETNDIAAVFISENCLVGPEYKTRSHDLYKKYSSWCDETGHKAKSETSMADDWERLGFEKKRSNSGMVWIGVGINFEV